MNTKNRKEIISKCFLIFSLLFSQAIVRIMCRVQAIQMITSITNEKVVCVDASFSISRCFKLHKNSSSKAHIYKVNVHPLNTIQTIVERKTKSYNARTFHSMHSLFTFVNAIVSIYCTLSCD